MGTIKLCILFIKIYIILLSDVDMNAFPLKHSDIFIT